MSVGVGHDALLGAFVELTSCGCDRSQKRREGQGQDTADGVVPHDAERNTNLSVRERECL